MIGGRAGSFVCAGVAGLALLGAAGGAARAAALAVTLEYAAGPGCPGTADFKAIVTTRLGRDPFTEGAPDHVAVRIAPRGGSLDGRIEWRDAAGKWAGDQSFSPAGGDCLRLVRAMGFALAVQIQLLATARADPEPEAPSRGEAAPAPAPGPPPPPAAPSPPPATPPPASAPAAAPGVTAVAPSPTQGPRPVLAAGVGPAVGLGLSSTAVPLGRVFGAVSWPRLSVELAAEASLPTTTRRPDGAGFSQHHLLAGAAACRVLARWRGCVVAKAGAIWMTGEIDRPTSAWVPIVEAGGRLGFSQPVGRRAFLDAHADALLNLTRWTATLDGVPVWTAPRFAAALGLDAGVRFP